jgi:DNA-binding transcriptional LysR family regulator
MSLGYDLIFVRDYNIDSAMYSIFPLITDQLMVAVSCDHRFAGRKSISLAKPFDENFILFNKGTLMHGLSVNACTSAGFEPSNFLFQNTRGKDYQHGVIDPMLSRFLWIK